MACACASETSADLHPSPDPFAVTARREKSLLARASTPCAPGGICRLGPLYLGLLSLVNTICWGLSGKAKCLRWWCLSASTTRTPSSGGKQQFASKWINTGIPFIQDISPGYDARIVFPGPHHLRQHRHVAGRPERPGPQTRVSGCDVQRWNGYTRGLCPAFRRPNTATPPGSGPGGVRQLHRRRSAPASRRIEAEDYDQMSGVQKAVAEMNGGGFHIGWLDTGDWLDYKIAGAQR